MCDTKPEYYRNIISIALLLYFQIYFCQMILNTVTNCDNFDDHLLRCYFHVCAMCTSQDYGNAAEVRNCRLGGLRDLKGDTTYVRDMIAYSQMNKLIGWGVAGFRIDAGKHMWPSDLRATLSKLDYLSTEWFPERTLPYVYQEVPGKRVFVLLRHTLKK